MTLYCLLVSLDCFCNFCLHSEFLMPIPIRLPTSSFAKFIALSYAFINALSSHTSSLCSVLF